MTWVARHVHVRSRVLFLLVLWANSHSDAYMYTVPLALAAVVTYLPTVHNCTAIPMLAATEANTAASSPTPPLKALSRDRHACQS